jgi:hypothetical protein
MEIVTVLVAAYNNKNRQNAHFLHQCFNLIMVSSTCFEHQRFHPQEDLYMQFCGISFIHAYKQSGLDIKHILPATGLLVKKCAFCWFLLHRYITMHGSKNVNYLWHIEKRSCMHINTRIKLQLCIVRHNELTVYFSGGHSAVRNCHLCRFQTCLRKIIFR